MDRKARGIPMMYSTTQRSLFMRLERYYDEMIRAKRTPIFILVGNKADKNQQREVSTLEGKQKAVAWGCRFYETSAKTRHNVEEAFSNIVRELRVTDEQKAHAAGAKIPTTTAMPSRWSKCVIL
jgi:GTPase KRas protein